MKRIIFFALSIIFVVCNSSRSQTLILKPDSAIGKDVFIATTYTCTPSIVPAPYETINFDALPDLLIFDWSLNVFGCSRTTHRSLLRFDGLNNLPSNAIITSATLNLFGVPSTTNFGNSSYPGAPFGTTNEFWVRRATSSWNEHTVTWSNQPSFDTTHQVLSPVSTSRYSWNTSFNVTTLVQDILASGTNNGFVLMLNSESMYREMVFASSDHADSSLWPELIINYSVDTCFSSFDWKIATTNPSTYVFDALDTSTYYAPQWKINNNIVGSSSSMSNFFSSSTPNSFDIKLIKGNTCADSIKICHGNRDIQDDYAAGTCNTHFTISGNSRSVDTIQLSAIDQSQANYNWTVYFNGTAVATYSNPATPRFKVLGGGWYTFRLSIGNGEECYRISDHHCFTDTLPSPLSVTDYSANQLSLSITNISPNPTSGDTHINFSKEATEIMELKVYDMTGKQLMNVPINPGTKSFTLPIHNFVPGIYQVQIVNSKTILNDRLIKL
ncbi:MAG TPA: DNRLRE domain-containing protein [Flavipsychrobacter sp.]|nr:DNRLRE domain-containing protein [Flavipsychrobacter sp.]